MPRRVLVSGASGFIGRWSVPPLIAAGYEVHALAREVAGRNLPPQLAGAALHRIDLLNAVAVESLMAAIEPSHLLHFAWIATPGKYWTSAENFRWLAAGKHLLQSFQAHGGRRAVMAGTCAEYDWSRVGVCRESASPLVEALTQGATETDAADADGAIGALVPTAQVTPYVACKLAMCRTLGSFARAHGLSTAWGRIFFQFGPDEHPDRLVASAIMHLLSGREALCTHGRQIRSFLHVADVGSAFAALLDSDIEGAVNIGSDERISIADLLGRIAAQAGRPDLIRLDARSAPPFEPPLLVPDIGRLRTELRWSPRFTLEAGIADTIGWWRHRLAAGSHAVSR